MSSSGVDLEVLPDGSESAVSPRSRHSRARRWMMVGAGFTLLAAVWLAFPVRSSLTRSEVRRLEGQWLHAQALDNGRFSVIGKLTATAVLTDEDRVRAGDAALYREEVNRLRAIHRALQADLLVDGGLSRLRADMDRALAAQTADLDRLAAWYSVTPAQTDLPPPERTPSTAAAIDRAYKLLDAQLHRFGFAARPLPGPPAFHSADSTLASMSRILNTPTGTRLIVETVGALLLVDVDANRITTVDLAGVPAPFQGFLALPRRTYVVLSGINGSSYVAAPLNLQGQVRPLTGDSVGVVAAASPDDVWLERSDGTAVEEDGQGRVLMGPVPVPNGAASLVGAVDAGLVLTQADPRNPIGFGLVVWNPATRTSVRTVTTDASNVMAVGGDTVVWLQDTASPNHRIVHLSTISTGKDRSVLAGPNIEPIGDRWSLSADGTKVASSWTNLSADTGYAPGFIDVASGRLDLAPVTLAAQAPSSLDWANRGDRIFITNNTGGPDTPVVLTYRLGSNTIEQLRLHRGFVIAVAVLPPDDTSRSP